MSHALDRALEDIIDGATSDSGRRHAGRPKQRTEHRHSSPYTRNNNGHRQQQQQTDAPDRNQTRSYSNLRGKWSHDLYERPSDINERLGGIPKRTISGNVTNINSINLRVGHGDKTASDTKPVRGISIAGLSRDTTPYDEFRVVWISGVPVSLTQERIEAIFGDVGRIDAVRMAVDGTGRFIGKLEIVYRLAEDARSAIQVFDGEQLYGTDPNVRVEKMSITYSSVANADFIDALKYERPRGEYRRHGQASFSGNDRNQRNGQASFNGNHGNQRNGRRRQGNDDSRPAPTTDQLDADLDAYMGGN
ncbi:hypothetical protein GGI13_004444 [Coemansia sp. RSA 455]|nr:hypothetical protein GGI13_004444 [Coemansia sp. RSA 455]